MSGSIRCGVGTMEYFLAIKRNKYTLKVWTNLENIMVGQKSWIPNSMIPLIESVPRRQIY